MLKLRQYNDEKVWVWYNTVNITFLNFLWW